MHKKGFTLMEVMITVVIVGILAAIAIPSYIGYVNRSRRAEAVCGLQAIELYEEKAMANINNYVDDPVLESYGLKPFEDQGGTRRYAPSKYYTFNVAPATDLKSYIATATPTFDDKVDSYDVVFFLSSDGRKGWIKGTTELTNEDLWKSLRF